MNTTTRSGPVPAVPHRAGCGLMVAVGTTVVVLLSGCGGGITDEPAPASTTTARAPVRACAIGGTVVDRCDPDAVLTAAAQQVFSYDPARQASQANAFVAAGPLLSETYRQQVGASAAVLAPTCWRRMGTLGSYRRAYHRHRARGARRPSARHVDQPPARRVGHPARHPGPRWRTRTRPHSDRLHGRHEPWTRRGLAGLPHHTAISARETKSLPTISRRRSAVDDRARRDRSR